MATQKKLLLELSCA